MVNLLLWITGNLWRTQEAYPFYLSLGMADFFARQQAKNATKLDRYRYKKTNSYKYFLKSKYNVFGLNS